MNKIEFYNTNFIHTKNGGISVWQGIRYIDQDQYLLCGTTLPSPTTGKGVVYNGNISFTDGRIHYINVPKGKSTSVYGPDYNQNTGIFNFVGSYVNLFNLNKGFIYVGKLETKELNNSKNYFYPSVNKIYQTVFMHSVSNGICVGNSGNIDSKEIFSFLYNLNDLNNPIEIRYPNSLTTTTYGIWYNPNLDSYTIVGGYSNIESLNINEVYADGLPIPYDKAFIADFDLKTNTFYNWTTLAIPIPDNYLTHIEGISGFFNYNDIYTLSMDCREVISGFNLGYYVIISRDERFNFIITKFVNISFDNNLTTSNSVANNIAVGGYLQNNTDKLVPFQAEIIG